MMTPPLVPPNASTQPQSEVHRRARVAILVNNPCIYDSRVIKEANALAASNWEVVVFCRTNKKQAETEDINSIKYLRMPWLGPIALIIPFLRPKHSLNASSGNDQHTQSASNPPPSRHSIPRRIRRFMGRHLAEIYIHWEFLASSQHYIRDYKPDIIHANDLETLPTAVSVSQHCGAKVVYDSHEIAIEEYTDQYWGRKIWRRFQEARLIGKVDLILSPGDGVSKYLENRYDIECPTVIYNSPAENHFENEGDVRTSVQVDEDTPLVVFTGKLRLDRGLYPLLHALALCEGFHLARVGPSDDELDFETLALAKKLGVTDRLHLLPPVPTNMVSPFISTADLGIICNQNLSPNFDLGMPNKLFEATLAGLPMAVANLSKIREFVTSHNLGLIMNEKDPSDIARAIKAVYLNRAEFSPSPEKLAQLVEVYGWEAQAKVLTSVYSKLHPRMS